MLQPAFSASQKGRGGLLARPHLPLGIQPVASPPPPLPGPFPHRVFALPPPAPPGPHPARQFSHVARQRVDGEPRSDSPRRERRWSVRARKWCTGTVCPVGVMRWAPVGQLKNKPEWVTGRGCPSGAEETNGCPEGAIEEQKKTGQNRASTTEVLPQKSTKQIPRDEPIGSLKSLGNRPGLFAPFCG